MTGPQFRKLRKSIKLTQPALAAVLDVNEMTISNWERGVFPVPTLAALALRHVESEYGRPARKKAARS